MLEILKVCLIMLYSFNQPLDWDTSSATSFCRMFRFTKVFNQPLNWITTNCDNFQEMFEGALEFNQQLDWDMQMCRI